MYKMPTKKDKTALEAIEAALEREKAEAKSAAARHKLTVERLRTSVKGLQVCGVDSRPPPPPAVLLLRLC
jgi:syndecan 1